MAFSLPSVGREPVETDPSWQYKRYDTIIGEGAMKKVYLGLDGVESKEVAWSKTELTKEMLKDKKLLQSLCTEAELMKVLRHDNIVTCFESWIDDEHKFINMITEYLPSGNLGEYVRRYNPVKRRVIREWCKQILRGLDYLHRNNIIHRDLNTDNIFIDGSLSTVKIGDLGLRLMFQHGAFVEKFSCRPEFMAPELLKDDEDYSQLIDIYSFGMCVLQMVTQETLYSECVNKYHIRAKVKTRVMPEALSRVQDEVVKEFIIKCLSSAPARPNASELLRDSFFGSTDSGNEAGSSSQSKSESEDNKQKGPAEILPSNDSNTEAGSSSQSKSEPGFPKEAFNEIVGEQPLSLRVQVQPRSFRLRGERLDGGTFKIRLYFNNARYEFDYSIGTIVEPIFEGDPVLSQLLSEMTTTEFVWMSAFLNEMVTSPESERGRIKFLEITSEGGKVRRVFQPTTTQKPQVTDPMQQP